MKKILITTLLAAAIFGCSHSPNYSPTPPPPTDDVRKPSQVSYDRFTVRGRVGMSVSKVDSGFGLDPAVDAGLDAETAFADHALYVIQVDCDGNRKLNRKEQGRVIKVSAKSTSKKQQRIFAAYKKRSERQNKTGGAAPYLEVSLTTENPELLCEGNGPGKVAYGTNPQFSYVNK